MFEQYYIEGILLYVYTTHIHTHKSAHAHNAFKIAASLIIIIQ